MCVTHGLAVVSLGCIIGVFKQYTILNSNVMGLPAAEVMFSKGDDFRMANRIVIRTHEHSMLDMIDLEDGSSYRRHRDQMRFRTDIGQEELRAPNLNSFNR